MSGTYLDPKQIAPSATTLTTLATVTTGKSWVISTILVCNRGSSATTYRIAFRAAGAAIDDKHYAAYDAPIAANETKFLTIGVALSGTTVISVYAGNANLSFQAFVYEE